METQRNSLCGSLEGRFILAVVVLVCGASQKWWHNYWLVVHLPSFVSCRAHRGRWGWAGGTNPWAGQSLWAFRSHINAVHFHMAQRATAAGNDYMLCRIHHLGEQEKVRQANLKCEYTLTNHFIGYICLVQGLALFYLQKYLNWPTFLGHLMKIVVSVFCS